MLGSKADDQIVIDARMAVCEEIFFSLLNSVKSKYREAFPPSTAYNANTWHDGDKRAVSEIAKMIFSRSVTSKDVEKMAEDVWIPKIEGRVKLEPDASSGEENSSEEELGDF